MDAEFFPFIAKVVNGRKVIEYTGNKIYKKISNILDEKLSPHSFQTYFKSKFDIKYWSNITKINSAIYSLTVHFFEKLGGKFVVLPLTTRMLSSPGAALLQYLRGMKNAPKMKLDVEVFPVTVDWFGRRLYLSESSQLYLEIALTLTDFKHVYSIYNSFRKEKADWSHLSEFHHIEYEGKVDQKTNENILKNLVKKLITGILNECEEELLFFVSRDYLAGIEDAIRKFERVSLYDALKLLYEHTGDKTYLKFDPKYFGSWEEVKLTNILGAFTFVAEFPYYATFFYQTYREPESGSENVEINLDGETVKAKAYDGIPVADNSDLIWPGYREIAGSGHRVRSSGEARHKIMYLFSQVLKIDPEIAKKLMEWYKPYISIRNLPNYTPTSGFGLGWERFLQGLLKLPTILHGSVFGRTHHIPRI